MKILIKKIKDVEIMYSFKKLKMLGNLKFKNLPKKYIKKSQLNLFLQIYNMFGFQ